MMTQEELKMATDRFMNHIMILRLSLNDTYEQIYREIGIAMSRVMEHQQFAMKELMELEKLLTEKVDLQLQEDKCFEN